MQCCLGQRCKEWFFGKLFCPWDRSICRNKKEMVAIKKKRDGQ
jgi:hypothetical protein